MIPKNQALIAGVDEAGRGPLAGPVFAAAVILNEKNKKKSIKGLRDSKLLTEKKREHFFHLIIENCIAWGVGRAEVGEIETLNIHNATLLAMQRAVMALSVKPHEVLVDGLFCPQIPYKAQAIVKGDVKIPVISAASIIAKVTRDAEMILLDSQYPGYGLAQHKGYPTKLHIQQLQRLGPSLIHRRNFAHVINHP